jgi:hypothetical protein
VPRVRITCQHLEILRSELLVRGRRKSTPSFGGPIV